MLYFSIINKIGFNMLKIKSFKILIVLFLLCSIQIHANSHPTVSTVIATKDALKRIEDHLERCRNILNSLTKNNADVLQQYNAFSHTLESTFVAGEGLIEKDIHNIIDAVIFSASQHRFQTRKNAQKTPYIIHPIGVADSLMNIGGVRDPDIIIAGLLHDTIEDTSTTYEDIAADFGVRVAKFVKEVTDDKTLPKDERKKQQVLHAGEKSAGAAQIKLADKLYNMSNILYAPPPNWEKERCDAYIKWGEQVVSNLPWVNSSLKQAVDDIVDEYWSKNKK